MKTWEEFPKPFVGARTAKGIVMKFPFGGAAKEKLTGPNTWRGIAGCATPGEIFRSHHTLSIILHASVALAEDTVDCICTGVVAEVIKVFITFWFPRKPNVMENSIYTTEKQAYRNETK